MIHAVLGRLLAHGQGNGLRAQLVRGAVGVGGLKLLSLPLTLLISILLARGLGPEGFGQYTFVIALVTTLSIPLAPALMQLTTRETAGLHQAGEDGRIRALLRWGNRFVLLGSAMTIAVVGGFALWYADWQTDDRWTMLLVGLIALPLLGLNAVRAGVLAGLRRVVQGQLSELVVRPLALLLVVATLLMVGGLTPLSAVVAFLIAAIAAFVMGAILLKRTFPNNTKGAPPKDFAQHRQWRRAWVPFTLLGTASTLNAQIGTLVLGWLSTNEQVAAMQIAERGAMLVALSLMVVNLAIGPHITQVHRSGDRAKLQALSRHSARMALVAALPVAAVLILLGGPILNLVFGAEYKEIATAPLTILTFGQLINVSVGSVGMLLMMSGYERDTLLGQVMALIVNVLAAVLLIPPMGAVGAAIATAIGLLVWNGALAAMVFHRLSIVPSPFSFEKKRRSGINNVDP